MTPPTTPTPRTAPIRALLDFRIHRAFRTGIGRYLEQLSLALHRRSDVLVSVAARKGSSGEQFAHQHGLPVHHVGPQRLPLHVRKGPFDLLHLTYPITAPAFGLPTVVTIHDLIYDDPRWAGFVKRRAFQLITGMVLRQCSSIVTVSHATADELRRRRHPSRPVVVAPNGVEGGWRAVQTRRRVNEFLYVGSLRPHKGIDVLLDAVSRAPGARLTVLSSESTHLWPELSEKLTPEAKGRVTFLPFADDETREEALRHTTAVIVPSHSEGFGLPLLEGLAMGAPVVCSQLPVFQEVAGAHALFFPDGDAEALSHVLAGGVPLVDPMVDDSARRHVQAFTWDRCAERVVAAYREALR